MLFQKDCLKSDLCDLGIGVLFEGDKSTSQMITLF